MKEEDTYTELPSPLIFLLMVLIFGGIIAVGVYGVTEENKTRESLIERCKQSEQCIEQVNSLKNDSFNCYNNTECRTVIRSLK